MSPNDVGLRRGDEAVVLDESAPVSRNPVAALAQAASTPALKILFLEDDPSDAALIQRELRKAGLDFIARRVDTRADFIEALESFAPDILLADYKLPNFNGAEALAHVRHVHPEIPVVMVTGALGEEAVIELLHAGAKDYVLKSNLLRLPSSVERALWSEQGIRARKAAEAALRASNALLQTAERIAHIGGFDWEIASGRILWSEETYRMFGLSPDEFVPTLPRFAECVHPDDRAQVQQAIDASVTRNEPFDTEFRILRPDKAKRIIHSRGEVISDENGLPIRMTGTCHDITGRKEAAAALALSEERHRTLVLATSQVVWTTDAQGKAVDDSPGWRAFTGLTIKKIKGDGWAAALHPDDRKPTMDVWLRAVDARALYDTEFRVRRHDGTYRYMAARGVPVLKEDGTVREWIGTCTDITERKEAERALHRVNRTLRTLSRGNEALVRATCEAELLTEMCRVIVETGGYRMAWIGVPQPDAARSVTPVAWAGEQTEFFTKQMQISWADDSLRRGITGNAVRSGEPQLTENMAADPKMSPWAALAEEYGALSGAAFPLKGDSGVFAVLVIYAAEPGALDTDELKLLQELADDLAFGIRGLREHTAREAMDKRWRVSLEATIGAIASTVEMRDPYTAGHQQRVARLAVAIARELHLSDEQIEGLYLAGIVHDVGKIDIPSDILNKPGKLSKLQYQLIQAHAEAGYDIVKGVDFPWPIAEMVRQHHERIDGSGYPRGLKAEAILPEAKILAVADVVESMMSHRPYRTSLGLDAALADIEEGKGRLYDPAAVAACTALFRENGFTFE
jgi:PAS domain S-box-containing protein